MPTVYPCVPGHEIVGRVIKVGFAVTKFKAGDLAGVGCLVDSDGTYPSCKAGLEQFCPNQTLTYGFPDKHLGGIMLLPTLCSMSCFWDRIATRSAISGSSRLVLSPAEE